MISIIIPSRNEPYLEKTIEDIQRHAVTDIEILAEEDDGRGQRAMCNKLARQAKGEYIMKTDAHCTFGYGFDEMMLKDMDDKIVMAPYLMVLDEDTWTVKLDKKSSSFAFNTNLAMDYHIENIEPINETMCMQGSCFMVAKDTYFNWNLCDETLGSWGHQGVELGIKTWANGGRCVTNKKTYYGHLFRHSDEDFPYERNQAEIDATHDEFIRRFKNKDLIPLIEKFDYPLDWTEELCTNLLD